MLVLVQRIGNVFQDRVVLNATAVPLLCYKHHLLCGNVQCKQTMNIL